MIISYFVLNKYISLLFPSFSQKYHHGKISILSSRRVFMSNIFHYNILVTLDRNYLKVLSVMLYSLSQSDPDAVFTVYVANNSLTEDDFPLCAPSSPAPSLWTSAFVMNFFPVRRSPTATPRKCTSDSLLHSICRRNWTASSISTRTLLSSTICAGFIPSTFKIICLPLPPTSKAPF